MTLNGVKLTFGDGTVFEASENIQVAHRGEPLYKLDGRQNLITIYEDFIGGGGNANGEDTSWKGAFVGFGAGIHTIEVRFNQYKGSGDSWGNADTSEGGDSAYTLMHELVHALLTKPSDSTNPMKLETGEFVDPNNPDDTGEFDELYVAVYDWNLVKTFGEDPSITTPTVTFVDAIDLGQAVSSVARRS